MIGFDYGKETKRILPLILSVFGIGLAIIGGVLYEFDDKFLIMIIIGFILFIISLGLSFSKNLCPLSFSSYIAIYNLKKEGVKYLGYTLTNEDVVRISYDSIGKISSFTYKLYETIAIYDYRWIYELMTNKTVMHEKNIYQLNEWIKKAKAYEEKCIFEEKVSKLWEQDKTVILCTEKENIMGNLESYLELKKEQKTYIDRLDLINKEEKDLLSSLKDEFRLIGQVFVGKEHSSVILDVFEDLLNQMDWNNERIGTEHTPNGIEIKNILEVMR